MKIHYTTHQSISKNKKLYLCQKCGKSCRSSSELEIHMQSHHNLPSDGRNKFKCDICDSKFDTKPFLTAHKRIHDDVFMCKECGKR